MLPQTFCNQFPVGIRRRHLFHEAADLGGEVGVALGEEDVAGGTPPAFNSLPGRKQLRLTGLNTQVAFQNFGGNGFSAITGMGGIAS